MDQLPSCLSELCEGLLFLDGKGSKVGCSWSLGQAPVQHKAQQDVKRLLLLLLYCENNCGKNWELLWCKEFRQREVKSDYIPVTKFTRWPWTKSCCQPNPGSPTFWSCEHLWDSVIAWLTQNACCRKQNQPQNSCHGEGSCAVAAAAAQAIRSPVTNENPCWTKILPDPAHFWKMPGELQDTCPWAPSWRPSLT